MNRILIGLALLLLSTSLAKSQTIITVNNPSDQTVPGGCNATNCTLRQAILDANNLPNSELVEIHFDLPTGSNVISISGILPPVEQPNLVIDGTSQTGASCGSLINGETHDLEIEIEGSGGNTGPSLRGTDQLLKGLVVRDFPNDGIQIYGTGNQVECSYIGTDITGNQVSSNNSAIRVFGDEAHIINNLLSGNSDNGISLDQNSDTSTIEGNLIGTSADGVSALPNSRAGIEIQNGSSNNVLGGRTTNQRNLISGNSLVGIRVESSNNIVEGNYIGTNRAGTAAIPNFGAVYVRGSNNSIGSSAAGAGNLISGNSSVAVSIWPFSGQIAQNNVIEGNFIGTDLTGNIALGNGRGVQLSDCSDNVIKENLISSNNSQGIFIEPGSVPARLFDNTIIGNKIGTNHDATQALPNATHGIDLRGPAGSSFPRATIIGGPNPGEGNVISGNLGSGIRHDFGGFVDTVIEGNLIGTNGTATAALPNGGAAGIELKASNDNQIRGNTISGNQGIGVFMSAFVRGTIITDNYIGTSANGADLGNASDGIKSLDECEIGGRSSELGNTIAFNGGAGIALKILVGRPCTVLGNSIYENDGLGIDLEANNLPNVNDALDTDAGSNDQLNHPIINSVTHDGGTMVDLDLSYSGLISNTFRVEIFTSSLADPSGYGEGEIFRTWFTISTDGSGNYNGTIALPATLFPSGSWVSATASIDGIAVPTSEFSPAILLSGMVPTLTLSAKAFLQGPYDSAGQMHDDLSSQNLIPLSHPYAGTPWNYTGAESVTSLPNNVVDWVLVELRESSNGATLAQKAGFLMSNGEIKDLDGISNLVIEGAVDGQYFLVLRHRLHLDIMSASFVNFSTGNGVHDFSSGLSKAFGLNPMIELGDGRFALWSGDGNADGSISSFDFLQTWLPQNGSPSGYHSGDFNLSGSVSAFDFLNAFLLGNGQSSQIP